MHTATFMYVVLCVYALCTSTRAQKSSSGEGDGATGIEQMILSRIENLEKKMDANAKGLKRQLRREIRRLKSGQSKTDDPSLLDELKAARMDIKQVLDRMEAQTSELRAMLNSSMVTLNNQREGTDPVMTSELQDVKTNLDEISEKVDAILGAMTSMSPRPTAFTDMVTQISGGDPPVVERMMQAIGRKEGSTLSLQCTARGDPLPDLVWEKVETGEQFRETLIPIETMERQRIRVTESAFDGDDDNRGVQITLRFTNLKSSDAGLYRCVARNSEGEDSKTTYLDVMGISGPLPEPTDAKTMQHYTTTESAVGPDSAQVVVMKEVMAGDTVQMTCRAPSLLSKVRWMRGNKKVPMAINSVVLVPDDRVSVDRTFDAVVLRIKNVTMSDAGEYNCFTSSSSSPDTTVTIHVNSPANNCMVTLAMDPGYFACSQAYMSAMTEASRNTDTLAVMRVMKDMFCSPGACMPRYVNACPEMKQMIFGMAAPRTDMNTFCELFPEPESA